MLAFFVQIASVAAASHGVDKVIAVGGHHSARPARTCGSATRAREEGSDEESRSWQARDLHLGQVRAPFAGELPMLQTSHLTLSGKGNILSSTPISIIRWDGVEINGTEALSLPVVARTDSQDWVLHS